MFKAKTKFNAESLKNKLKNYSFFSKKLFLTPLIRFLFFLKRYVAFFEFITKICSYFAI